MPADLNMSGIWCFLLVRTLFVQEVLVFHRLLVSYSVLSPFWPQDQHRQVERRCMQTTELEHHLMPQKEHDHPARAQGPNHPVPVPHRTHHDARNQHERLRQITLPVESRRLTLPAGLGRQHLQQKRQSIAEAQEHRQVSTA